MYLPVNKSEAQQRGWERLDIVLVSGDAYIDSPYSGTAMISRWLVHAGFRVGIIAQPDTENPADITRLGEPLLYWGITGGCVDSMIANYTALKKRRKSDDFTPGGINNRRPDRAVIVYANLIRKYFKNTVPLVLGGIETSLRRIAHYDYWSNSIRRSILFDAKADYCIYGMGEKAAAELAHALKNGSDATNIRGLCYVSKNPVPSYQTLPSYKQVQESKNRFTEMFATFYANTDPHTASGLQQEHGGRFLVQNPPQSPLSGQEMDTLHGLPFIRDAHPSDRERGHIRALETIRFSIPSHRGCYGECNFCSITVHQGATVSSRSEESILAEAKLIAGLDGFKGYISNIGGPTANMYGIECRRKLKKGICRDKRCLFPSGCKTLLPDHRPFISLLRKVRKIKGIKKVFIASGIRYDLILNDKKAGEQFLRELFAHHISGQLKIAPEHTEQSVLMLMGKTGRNDLVMFKKMFDTLQRKSGKKQFLTYYLVAAHPGSGMKEMREMNEFIAKELLITPEQVQIFTPSPSTYSTLMYYTEKDPVTGKKIYVEKDLKKKRIQKEIITKKKSRRT